MNYKEENDLNKKVEAGRANSITILGQGEKFLLESLRIDERLTTGLDNSIFISLSGAQSILTKSLRIDERLTTGLDSSILKSMSSAQSILAGSLRIDERLATGLGSSILKSMTGAQSLLAESLRIDERLTTGLGSSILKSVSSAQSILAKSFRIDERLTTGLDSSILKSMSSAQSILVESLRIDERLTTGLGSSILNSMTGAQSILAESLRIDERLTTGLGSSVLKGATWTYPLLSTLEKTNQIDDELARSISRLSVRYLSDMVEAANIFEDTLLSITPQSSISYRSNVKISIFEKLKLLYASEKYLEQSIYNLVKCAGENHPIVRFLVIAIALPILINIYSATSDPIIPNNILEFEGQKKTAIMTTQINCDYRYVSASCLNVRMAGSLESRIIGKLYLGQLVKVIKERDNWALVEYKNANETALIKGWVSVTYIKKMEL